MLQGRIRRVFQVFLGLCLVFSFAGTGCRHHKKAKDESTTDSAASDKSTKKTKAKDDSSKTKAKDDSTKPANSK